MSKHSDYSEDETHLGDGLYASHDGYQIWLRAERPLEEWAIEKIKKLPKDYNGPAIINHRVALDPAVLRRLIEYAEKINNEAE